MPKGKAKTRTVYRKAKTYARRMSGSKKGSNMIAGLAAGIGGSILGKFINLGGWSQPAADIGAGYFLKNDTLETIGFRSVGNMLAGGFRGGGTGSTDGSVAGLPALSLLR